MDETYPGPETIDTRPRAEGEFHTRELSRLILRPVEHHTEAANRVGGYIKKGYLSPVGRDVNDARGAYIFDRTAALAAALYSEMAGAGLVSPRSTDRDAAASGMGAARLRLYMWREKEIQVAKSPLHLIWATFDADPTRPPGWSLRLQWRRHITTGDFYCTASLLHLKAAEDRPDEFGTNRALREGYWPTCDMVLPIDPHLAMIAARMRG
jgi:hypothetical protein